MHPDGIDEHLARKLVVSQFPQWAHLPLKPVAHQGVDNRTFRLGDEMSVRLPSDACYAGQVDKEQLCLPRLRPHLPLTIPEPLAQGEPDHGYPHRWSVYRWLPGATPTDWQHIATPLGDFLATLRRIDPDGAPEPGPHNFFRGAHVGVYAGEAVAALDKLSGEVDPRAHQVWDRAVATRWDAAPGWCHGDVAPGNLLVRDNRLTAVIDFGCCGVGDPACDTVIAWTHLDATSRSHFRRALGLDDHTWARGRGWALWKALITLVAQLEADDPDAATSRAVIARIADDAAPK